MTTKVYRCTCGLDTEDAQEYSDHVSATKPSQGHTPPTTERTHTPGDWTLSTIVEYNGELRDGWYGVWGDRREVARVHVDDPASTNARDDARLIALAPTAPHKCAPDCPGEQNRRKLAAHDALIYALEYAIEMQGVVEATLEPGYGTPKATLAWMDNARAALALARGDA